MVLYIKRCFPLKLDLNLPDHSQFHKTPTACPPHLQPARPTNSLPAISTACPPHLQPARPTYSLPATPTGYPLHPLPAHHTYSLPTTPTDSQHLLPAHQTYSLPAIPTACPPHLQVARYTYRLPCAPTGSPLHLLPAHHTFKLNYTMSVSRMCHEVQWQVAERHTQARYRNVNSYLGSASYESGGPQSE